MKKVIVLVLSISLIGSIYYIYDNLNNKENIIIKEDKLEEEFISYTLNGSSTDISYEELVENNKVNSVTCENGSTAVWNEEDKSIKLSNVNVPDYCVIDFSTESLSPQFISKILADNPTISERTDFGVTNTSNTTGTIYKTNKTEDGSEVYYYSGNTTNNWVYFGGFYWRIIRTNEDGSVRLLYAGTSHNTTSGFITYDYKYNSSHKESRYVGYMYGGNTSLADNRANTTSSTIKTYIDTWYQNNLLTNYDKYISKTALYCNDRSIGSGTWANFGGSFFYGVSKRMSANTPNYKCGANTSGELFESTQATEDKFSVSTSNGGNGNLTYPIALMTADEVVFAGGKYGKVLSRPYAWYYLNSAGNSITGTRTWWTLSPQMSDPDTASSIVYFVYGNSTNYIGYLTQSSVTNASTIRPVVSLSSCIQVTGTGTPTDPYIIDETNSTC